MPSATEHVLGKGLLVLGTFMLLGFFTSYHLLLLSKDSSSTLVGEDVGIINNHQRVERQADDVSSSSTTSTTPDASSISTSIPTTSDSVTVTSPTPSGPSTTSMPTKSYGTSEEPVSEETSTASTSSAESTEKKKKKKKGKGKNKKQQEITTEPSESTVELPSSDYDYLDMEPCFARPYELRGVCESEMTPDVVEDLGANVTIDDLGGSLFVWDLVEAMIYDCEAGTWCLTSSSTEVQTFIKTDNQAYLQFCPLSSCLLQISDECMNEERRNMISTLIMLCEGKESNGSDHCLSTMRKMAHISMADDFRYRRNPDEMEYAECQAEMTDGICSGRCQDTATHLMCLAAACEHQQLQTLEGYAAWQWFYSDSESLQICNMTEDTDCTMFQVKQSWIYKLLHKDTFVEAVQDMNVKIISIVIGSLALASIAVITTACACTHRRKLRLRYSRDEVEYKEVKSAEATVDSDEDDIFGS